MRTLPVALLMVGFSTLASGCAGRGWDPQHPQATEVSNTTSPATVAEFRSAAPELKRFFDHAYGVAVFPTVGKGAATFGGAYGKGEVYERDQLVGSAWLYQVSAGATLGGQAYSELIFFEDKAALDHFKSGDFELGAQASAVAMTAGVSASASYDDGVAIFTLPKGGLMYEAAVAGQKFRYASR